MPKNPTSLNPFRLIGEAWTFAQKQPALFSVFFWFLMLPTILIDVADVYWPQSTERDIESISLAAFGFAMLILGFITYWGLASVFLVGKRMVVNRAGRSRTSFRSVRRESAGLILPLFFTTLLRAIVTIEWMLIAIVPAIAFVLLSQECRAAVSPLLSGFNVMFNGGGSGALKAASLVFFNSSWPLLLVIPLLIPALIYQIRTVFFGVIVGSEDLRYRDALRRSRDIIRGHAWKVFGVLIALCVILLAPVGIVATVLEALGKAFWADYRIAGSIVIDALYSFMAFIFTLALIAMYGKLRKRAGRVEEVVPEME